MQKLSSLIKNKALSLGFDACGIAPVHFAGSEAEYFDRWIAEGCHAGMKYMENYRDIRLNPAGLVEGARSVISVALNYYPAVKQSPDAPRISYYAYGKDYHIVLKEKLRQLWEYITEEISSATGVTTNTILILPDKQCQKSLSCHPGLDSGSHTMQICNAQAVMADQVRHDSPSFPTQFIERGQGVCHSSAIPAARLFTDSAPLLERYWAWRAGLGWIGKNTNLIIPGKGSFFFLGEIVTTLELDYDTPQPSRCGSCRRCLDACPTAALEAPRRLNASKCLSYLTIEHRGDISAAYASRLGNRLYGCDTCQEVCPWNRFARPTGEAAFAPSDDFLSFKKEDLEDFTREDYNRIFARSAVKRAKYEGLIRTINNKNKP